MYDQKYNHKLIMSLIYAPKKFSLVLQIPMTLFLYILQFSIIFRHSVISPEMLHVEPMSKCIIHIGTITRRVAPLKLDYLGTKDLGLSLFLDISRKVCPLFTIKMNHISLYLYYHSKSSMNANVFNITTD